MSYFYIIEHISSGRLYAGSRTAKNCSPCELLKSDGYKTSSNIVKKILKEEGIGSFKVRFIKEFEDSIETLEWETRFLKKVDAANCDLVTSNNHYNRHIKNYHPETLIQEIAS